MQLIPLQAVPSQTLAVTLARQAAQIAVRQNGAEMYFDLLVGTTSIVRARICLDRARLLLGVRYRGFVGDFAFVDLQGNSNPNYAGLGSRFQLFYLGAGE